MLPVHECPPHFFLELTLSCHALHIHLIIDPSECHLVSGAGKAQPLVPKAAPQSGNPAPKAKQTPHPMPCSEMMTEEEGGGRDLEKLEGNLAPPAPPPPPPP
eukprot:Sspe_Gene.47734::Locus_24494_Transcript_1_1_Confidence_1.000_Length_651::g.47734::m.47734